MSGLDLDKLKSQWAQESQKLDNSLALDVAAVREALTRKTVKAFRRHSYWQIIGLIFSSASFVALLAFIISNWADKIYVLMAVPLAMLALGEAITDLLELSVLRTLNFSSPMLALNETLNRVRDRRLRMTKWILLTSIALWFPLIFVLLKGVLGVDLLPWIHPSVLLINTGFGLAFILVAYLSMLFISKRFGASPGYQRFLEDSAGRSWSRARKQLDAHEHFENEIASHGNEKALQRFEKRNLLSPVANAKLGTLRLHALAWIIAYGCMISMIGVFNAGHGGQWQFIVPGIVLNLLFVSQMVSGITYRISLSRLDLGLPHEPLCDDLNRLLEMRLMLARAALSAMPLIGAAAVQVLSKIIFGIDLIGGIPVNFIFGLLLLLAAGGIPIYQKSPDRFIYGFANVSSFGVFKRSKILVDAIKQAAEE